MSTLSFGNLHAFVDTLAFELEQQRRQAARERMLRTLADEHARPRRTDRPSWHHRRPGSPSPSSAH